MPVKCYIKPNRRFPRVWTARAAARAVCSAVEHGASPAAIRLEMAECVPCSENRRKQQQQQQALQALEQSQRTFAVADGALGAFQLISRWVGRVARFVPAARPAGLALGAIERALGTVRSDIVVARAANDAAIVALRLAA